MAGSGPTRRNLRPPPRIPFQRIEGLQIADPKIRNALHRMQSNIEKATQISRGDAEAKGKTVNVTIQPPDTGAGTPGNPSTWPTVSVSHGLGRQPVGYKVVDRTGSGDATLSTRTGWSARTLTFAADGTDGSAAVTLTLSVW